MIVAMIGRSPWPLAIDKLRGLKLNDEIDAAVVKRSRRLPRDVFHGMVEFRCELGHEEHLVELLKPHGWRRYRRRASE